MLRTFQHQAGRLVQTENGKEGAGAEADAPATLPVWIDLLEPTPEEDRAIERLLDISLPTREEMQEIEVSARLYAEDGAEFMTIAAVINLESDTPTTTPITFILKGSTLVTVRYTEPKAFTNFVTRAAKVHAVPCLTGEQVMLGLIEQLSDRMADALERVGAEVDTISHEVFRGKPGANARGKRRDLEGLLEKIGTNGDFLSKLRESLVSIHRLLAYHTSSNQNDKKANKEARTRLKVLYRDTLALTEHTAFLSQKINFLLDATLGLINLQQNQIIKIFSVAAVVFLPPTLIASIYGMNFRHIPELDWIVGYPYALFLMILSAIMPYWYFKRRGWL